MTCPRTHWLGAENREYIPFQGELRRRIALRWRVERHGAEGIVKTSLTIFTARAADNPNVAGLTDVEEVLLSTYPPQSLGIGVEDGAFEAVVVLRPGLRYRGVIEIEAPEGCNAGSELDARTRFEIDVAPCRCEEDYPFTTRPIVLWDGVDITEEVMRGEPTGAEVVDVVIVATPPQPIAWRSPPSPLPGEPTRARVALPTPGAEVEVRAEVGPAPCTVPISFRVRRAAQEQPPAERPSWCPSPAMCPFWEATWVLFFIIGCVAAAIAMGVLTQGSVVAFVLVLFRQVMGGVVVIAIVICLVAYFFAIFLASMGISAVAVLIWGRCCKPSPCRVLRDLSWAIRWSRLLCCLVSIVLIPSWIFPLALTIIDEFIVFPSLVRNGCKTPLLTEIPFRQ